MNALDYSGPYLWELFVQIYRTRIIFLKLRFYYWL